MTNSFFRLQCLQQADSTNLRVKNAAEAGEPEGFAVQALEQTAGVGRQGRRWESPQGNLYISVLLRPRCTPQEACFYSFAAALAVYEAVANSGGDKDLQFKWPNDVLVDGRKISGILLETGAVEDGLVPWIVIGVGINVLSFPQESLCPATSLQAEGYKTTVESVRDIFLDSLHHWVVTLQRDGFYPLRCAWLVDARRGEVSVKLPDGEIRGTFGGMDKAGGLILRLANGTEKVIQTGDVFFV